jgi:hypothetical protein
MSNSKAYDRGDKLITRLTTPMGEVSLRSASIEDAASLLALRLEALAMHPESFAADVVRTAAGGVKVWVECIREYANTFSGAIMLALAEDELIGCRVLCGGIGPRPGIVPACGGCTSNQPGVGIKWVKPS